MNDITYKKILNRTFKNVCLTDHEWDNLFKDLREKTKTEVCAKYGLKNSQYKAIKRYFIG